MYITIYVYSDNDCLMLYNEFKKNKNNKKTESKGILIK